jgi:hypothetical protein
MNVRFLHNFVLTVVQTELDEHTDKMVVKNNNYHIQTGDVHIIEKYEKNDNNTFNLYFPKNSNLKGVSFRVEGDYLEISDPSQKKDQVYGGCLGCGK